MLVRAVGLALAGFGVPDFLADPKLEIIRSGGNATVAENDNWSDVAPDVLRSSFERVAAFPLPSASKDAALVASLEPGAYTVRDTGVGGTTGVALVEIYEEP